MRLDTSQQLKLSQEMKLSPKMIQAMEILQLPALALEERINAELAANPVLEVADSTTPDDSLGQYQSDRGDNEFIISDNSTNSEDFARLDDMTQEFGADFACESASRYYTSYDDDAPSKMDAIANSPAPVESLSDHLIEQLAFIDAPESDINAAKIIISHLENDGYLRTEISSIIKDITKSGNLPDKLTSLTEQNFSAGLAIVQSLEPLGVGAQNIKQCLQIQLNALENAGEDVSVEQLLVKSYLKEIEMNRLPIIERKSKYPLDTIKSALANLAKLDPKPGLKIGSNCAPIITPDVVITVTESGDINATMTEDYTAGITINELYSLQANDDSTDEQTKKYLRKNIRSAQWIIEAIAQRKRTIRKVAEEIFKIQRDFLNLGDQALKPLPMSDIADKVGVHVATVSRAVADKYALTPRGIFPLRMFFSGGTKSAAGDDVSWDAVKVKLQEIVNNENKLKPLSDEKLAAEMKKVGLPIARRTVAKYRDILNIPPARKRKQY